MSNQLEQLSQLLDYLEVPNTISPQDESKLEQAGFAFNKPKEEDKSGKWMGKYKLLKRDDSVPDNETYKLPVSGGLVSRFDPNLKSETHPHGHPALDLGSEKGTPVHSMGPGIVAKIFNESNNPSGGNGIYIKHPNGITSYYAHLDSVNVKPNDRVSSDTIIGTVGNSGGIEHGKRRGLSPHLHWQVKINGHDIDPLSIIGKLINVEAAVKETLRKLSNRI